ncbi:hypothetical protein CC1G_12147 [Coprinopsis cinerea okayama7|uniref:DUF6533 domain-containing protein n=1 Tax=Coprinopsis cinerea (strain Okayama-7 / 130 / ATCC MYA-4618 / FGSC 9003) TaxID=240176 RepID=A8P6Z2_COPC7|nr:hypothetical protein CC1G_12147 [Coprinopsis cinerea okayama7\|eukprot:XP_001839256.2 hypothetical protein CC1G_12147 [Coprinopsis cinerea okayama7\
MVSLFDVESALRDIRVSHAVQVGSIGVWVYDYFLVLSEEIELVWFSKWSLVKFIYLAARIVNPVHLACTVYLNHNVSANGKDCQLLFGLATFSGFVEGLLLCDAVMYLQVYAFSHCNKWIGMYLGLQFFLAVVTGVTLQAIVFKETIWFPLGIPGLHCVPINLNLDLFAAVFASSIPQWAILVGITIYIMFRKYRQLKSAVLNALLRDGLIYMYGMFAFCIATTVITYEAPQTLKFIIGIPKSVFLNILVSRLILHLRGAAREHTEQKSVGFRDPTKSFTGIHFAPRRPRAKTTDYSAGSGSTYVDDDSAIVL